MTRKSAVALFIFSVLFFFGCVSPHSRTTLTHNRPAGFWENEKTVVQILHTFQVAKLDDSGKLNIEEKKTLGSGIVVNVNGLVITNNHAIVETEPSENTIHISGSDKIEVCLVKNGLQSCKPALVIDRDSGNDMALLMAIERFEYVVTFVDDHSLELGDTVYLWGNIYDWTPASPIFGRFINRIEPPYVTQKEFDPITLPVLLMDISFVQGSSGGPTFDELGRCVGQNKFFTNGSGGRSIAITTPSSTIMNFLKKNKVPFKVEK